MTRYANAHSSAVAWLKVLLPLAALGVLATLFMVSHRVDPNDAIALSGISIEDRIRKPRLTAPVWAGVTEDGSDLNIVAAEARPAPAGGTAILGPDADAVVATLTAPSGLVTTMTGDHGALDESAANLTMTGHVVVTTSTGFQLLSEALVSALDATLVVSEGPVTGTGPFGRIDAGSMRLTLAGAGGAAASGAGGVAKTPGGGYLLDFKKGVEVVFQPRP